eukprot:TRINITY_DN1216_c0_g1_i1.p2 TRINITY_DN1216_c0_g1~~TRINITY_DN1216_c0_g1_i1.p2  ORF type:complete len:190 (+),score=32.28 TRINITY_DN1216_c0_g1_i1:218-787(+)
MQLVTEDYQSAIYFGQEALNLPLNEENKFKCIMYVAEAYCHVDKQKDALQLVQQAYGGNNNVAVKKQVINQIVKQSNAQKNGLRTKSSLAPIHYASIQDNQQPLFVLYTNLIMLNLANNNMTGAEQCIQNALANFDANSNNQAIPLPLLNLMIYFYLKKNNQKMALQIIKKRRLFLLQNQFVAGKVQKK